MKKHLILFLVIPVLALSSCKDLMQPGASTATGPFDGTYQVGCAWDGLGQSTYEMTITNTSADWTYISGASNDACATMDRKAQSTHTFAYGQTVAVASGSGTATQLDITYGTTVTLTPMSAAGVTAMNNLAECGKTDWALNVPFTCTQASLTQYSLVQLFNGVLYTGLTTPTYDASTPANRPVDVDLTGGWTKM